MSDSLVQVAPDSTGKKIQCFLNTVAGQQVEAQAVSIVDTAGAPVTEFTVNICGTYDGGTYHNPVRVDNTGNMMVRIKAPTAAFGEILSVCPCPMAQLDWIYGINSETTTSTVTGSGAVTATGALMSCSTTAANNSSAQLTSRRYVKYRDGQGAVGRFTAKFTTGVAGSNQFAGLATPTKNNGYLFGYSGATFGIWHYNAGSPTFVAQANWNVDNCTGVGGITNKSGFLLDPTKGNVYQIKYQFLGFGAAFFGIEDPATGEFTLVHYTKYANANTVPNLSQSSLNLFWKSENVANNTDIVVSSASGALFVEGQVRLLGTKRGFDFNKATVTTETNIISIRNATTFNGVTNRGQLRIRTLSFGSNTGGAVSGIATLRAVLNTTLGGSPSFAAAAGTTADNGVTITNGTSPASYDTAGTTVTGGTILYSQIAAVGNSALQDVTDLDIFINPGDTLTLSITSTQSATVGVGVQWNEDI